MLNYEILRIIWWILLGVLLVGFAVMDGFDLGAGILLHRVARTNAERRQVLNAVGPTWEGNQVWLILGGGAIFAAWPSLYGLSFSGFYFAMIGVLFALILRPVGFKYRSKIDNEKWRACWDIGLFIGGFVPALLFGVAMGNVLRGVPFYFDDTLRAFYTGSFFALLNPFAILAGLISVAMLSMHGANFLMLKTDGAVAQRAARYSIGAALLTMLLFGAAGVWVAHLNGYQLVGTINPDGPSNPLYKQAIVVSGAWIHNYQQWPWLMLVPLIAFAGAFCSISFVGMNKALSAWISSAVSVAGIISTAGISMFPFLMPSSSNPSMSLTVWDASSSHLTLMIMLVATVIFMPIILFYTSWVYYIMRGKVTSVDINNHSKDRY